MLQTFFSSIDKEEEERERRWRRKRRKEKKKEDEDAPLFCSKFRVSVFLCPSQIPPFFLFLYSFSFFLLSLVCLNMDLSLMKRIFLFFWCYRMLQLIFGWIICDVNYFFLVFFFFSLSLHLLVFSFFLLLIVDFFSLCTSSLEEKIQTHLLVYGACCRFVFLLLSGFLFPFLFFSTSLSLSVFPPSLSWSLRKKVFSTAQSIQYGYLLFTHLSFFLL